MCRQPLGQAREIREDEPREWFHGARRHHALGLEDLLARVRPARLEPPARDPRGELAGLEQGVARVGPHEPLSPPELGGKLRSLPPLAVARHQPERLEHLEEALRELVGEPGAARERGDGGRLGERRGEAGVERGAERAERPGGLRQLPHDVAERCLAHRRRA